MNDQNLRELLEKLHNELEHIEVNDEAGKERIRHLEADIRALRERSDEQMDTDESMLERFQDSIDHFEDTYPQLTMMISQMMTILSNAGI
jgi:predicted  nucleic acid-binding Zn-ribbon protein